MVDMGDLLHKVVFCHAVKGFKFTMHCSSDVHSKKQLELLFVVPGDS